LDVGADKGVSLNAAVVVRDGLIGSVVQVGQTWSRVSLITDGSSRIPVSFYPSGEKAILVGNSSSRLRIDLLQNKQIGANQTAFTSGVDGRFPNGILVGSLDSTDDSECVVPAATVHNAAFVCILVPISSQEDKGAL
jgi:rod shape-determining protein MreC